MTANQKTPTPAKPALKYPPGPRPLPVVGSALSLGREDPVRSYARLWREYGDIVYLKLGPLDSYILVNPDHVNHVLVKNQKNYVKGRGYDGFRLMVGMGLVTSDGELWRQQRRIMSPPFTPTAMTRFTGMMADVTARMLDRWDAAAEQGRSLHMDEEMMRLTMSIIGRAMFSIDLGEEMTEVADALHDGFSYIAERSISPLALPLSAPLPSHRRFQRDLAVIDDFVADRVADGRKRDGATDLLSILLRVRDEETGYTMSDRLLRDEVVTLFFAGFETTARSLTWAWYLLGRHPEALAKLEAEADRVLAGGLATDANLPELCYTRMVVDETLRLYPPTALLARQPIEEDEIGGYHIPAGALVVLAPHLVHRYPGIWDDPERFDPERFTPEAVAGRPKPAYIPFASGPRVCLGNSFALQEMVIALAMAAARYHLRPTDDAPIDHVFRGTTRPTRPLMMTAALR